ncbi:MAG: cytochrome P450 [Acidobacteriota bacterium]
MSVHVDHQISHEPPGPAGQPFLGSIAELRRNPMDFFTRISQEYGGLCRFFYGRNPTFLASTPEVIKELLVDRRKVYIKNKRYKALRELIGDGMLLSEGETWRTQRRATAPGFSNSLITDALGRMVEIIDERLDGWAADVERGEPVEIEPRFSAISQALIAEWTLGGGYPDLVERLITAQLRLSELWPKPPRTVLGAYVPPSRRRMRGLKECLAELNACFYEAIRRERAQPSDGEGILPLLARFGTERSETQGKGRPETPFTDQELRDQLITLYMAGFETSAATASWLFYRLSLQPEARAAVYAEAHAVFRDNTRNDDERTMEQRLEDLDLTRRSVQETLRIYPAAYNFSRVALEDTTLAGYAIPEGAMVIVSPWATHRLPSIYENPEGFDPDRFLPENAADRSAFAFIPFGAGHRACIGTRLAMAQMPLVIARTCLRYRLDLAPSPRVEPAPGSVLRPNDGMKMVIQTL